ncbi:hypothetical protein [Legionella sp. 16cNR16C]|uniref:hypothetical protein n=1 Tax=Legionella sp. 16cNR16C TaxID=2905656 RepID=UPI001E2BCDFA|nr:hypothetical protein [Legionella sp. 16cNR16C]MCE3044208.1 hypothetical protein [Legionella sp. 16cNR16C]
MQAIEDNLKIFTRFIAADCDLEDVETHFKKYDNNFLSFERDFYVTPIDSTDECVDAAIELLQSLHIDFKLWPSYFAQNLSTYEFLKKIVRDHELSIQLNNLIDAIEKRKRYNNILFALKILVPICLVLIIMAGIFHSQLEEIIRFLLFSAGLLPVFGIIVSIFSIIFQVIFSHLNDRRPIEKIYRDDAFIVLNNTLNIVAKTILMAAKYTFVPLAAFFFIAAAVIEVLKELFYLLELHHTQTLELSPEEKHNFASLTLYHQQGARLNYDFIKQRNAFIINIVAALTLAISVTACAFLPAGFVLTLATCSVVSIVFCIKKLALYINDIMVSNTLQQELKSIADTYATDEKSEAKIDELKESIYEITNPDVLEKIQHLDDGSHAVRVKPQPTHPSVFGLFRRESRQQLNPGGYKPVAATEEPGAAQAPKRRHLFFKSEQKLSLDKLSTKKPNSEQSDVLPGSLDEVKPGSY